MTDPTEARRQLEKLLSHLRTFRTELEDAKREDLWFVAERAEGEIRRLHERIRRHCKRYRLPQPSDVPESG